MNSVVSIGPRTPTSNSGTSKTCNSKLSTIELSSAYHNSALWISPLATFLSPKAKESKNSSSLTSKPESTNSNSQKPISFKSSAMNKPNFTKNYASTKIEQSSVVKTLSSKATMSPQLTVPKSSNTKQ